MSPYLPFAALPIAVAAAWFGASNWSASEPGRYQVPRVTQIDDPSAFIKTTRSEPAEKADINVKAFLPHVPPRPPAPEPTLILDSVMTGTGVGLASINGRIVKKGDRVEGYVVRRIAADGVQLADGDRTRRLLMRPIHELPPVDKPVESPKQKDATSGRGKTDLTRDFWKIFDSLKI